MKGGSDCFKEIKSESKCLCMLRLFEGNQDGVNNTKKIKKRDGVDRRKLGLSQ